MAFTVSDNDSLSQDMKKQLRTLRRAIIEQFNLDSLQVLVYDLEMSWHMLSGDKMATKTNALVMHLAANGRLADLLPLLKEEKPNIDWQQIMADALHEETVRQYISHASALLTRHGQDEGQSDHLILAAIKKETSSILEELDGVHKASIFRFLCDSGLISKAVIDTETADLSEVILSGTSLLDLDLAGAQLFKANLSKANLAKANLQGANLRSANLGGTSLWGANLQGADLHRAHLWGANLNKANLFQANLSGARLSGAVLWGADLRLANLENAYLWGADLRDANLWGAQNVTNKQLQMVKSLQGATLPNGDKVLSFSEDTESNPDAGAHQPD